MSVVTRFAPSPTGYLHIGSVRTALFNWLFAKHHGGTFHLRIEDTDRVRSTEGAVQAIFEGMNWMGLTWDGDAVFQFARAKRHAQVAHELLAQGKAYYCYCTPEELQSQRDLAMAEGRSPKYNGYWRDRDPKEAPEGIPPVIRLRTPQTGDVVIPDLVQGEVRIQNKQLDDMVLLRADGTPTYMLSVVVDDHDMNITHIIRGDDHLTNAFRQYHLYAAMGWEIPKFAHIPLIHGPDGAKLSKRHGALGAQDYRDMGFLPEAMFNYLLRLGWGHGDEEIISLERAIEIFDITGVGKSPARFDVVKLTNLNGYYMREAEDARLVELILPFLGESTDLLKARLLQGMNGLKQRAKTIIELAESAKFYKAPVSRDEKAQSMMTPEALGYLAQVTDKIAKSEVWEEKALEDLVRSSSEEFGIKLGALAQPLRVALTGSTISPSIFEIMIVLGKEETLNRLRGA